MISLNLLLMYLIFNLSDVFIQKLLICFEEFKDIFTGNDQNESFFILQITRRLVKNIILTFRMCVESI